MAYGLSMGSRLPCAISIHGPSADALVGLAESSLLSDDNGLDDDRLLGFVAGPGGRALDRLDDVHALDHLPKDRVLRRRRGVEVVEEVVVDGIDEDLRAARVGLASVRHADGARLVGDGLDQLIGDVAAT